MQDLPVSWGETLPFIVEIDDPTAESATLTVSDLNKNIILTKSGDFTPDTFDVSTQLVDLSLNADETQLALGEYLYQLRIDFTGTRVLKFPDKDNCDGCGDSDELKYPKIIVMAALDEGPVS